MSHTADSYNKKINDSYDEQIADINESYDQLGRDQRRIIFTGLAWYVGILGSGLLVGSIVTFFGTR